LELAFFNGCFVAQELDKNLIPRFLDPVTLSHMFPVGNHKKKKNKKKY
jgi:hypothetical protein